MSRSRAIKLAKPIKKNYDSSTSLTLPTIIMPSSFDFHGKKFTVMGLGLLGRGIGDIRFLAAHGADLIVTDLKTETDLASSIASLAEFPNIVYHLGGHRLEDFENRDMIIRAPNAPLDSPFLAHARERGVPIEMDASLFVKLCDAITIVGVTGTRGKSTTTHLIYQMVREAFEKNGANIYLGGNERNTATLPLIEKISAGDFVVLELDSWQLQGFDESRISPHVAVWTNFMPDHMNYYHGDMDRYFADKAAIARYQRAGDFFIAPRAIKEKIEARFGVLAGKWIEPASEVLRTIEPANNNKSDEAKFSSEQWEITLPGKHNRANAACAASAARALGISDGIIKKVLKNFTGLPGRLEFLGEKDSVEFYNDSNSTTPDATIVALNAIVQKYFSGEEKNGGLILIAGGSDKELDFANLAREVEKLKMKNILKSVVLFEGKATEKLKSLLPKDFEVIMASNMPQAFDAAVAAAQKIKARGDINPAVDMTMQSGQSVRPSVILLSPGATSFGIFKNEYDRGDQFREAFKNLAH